MSAAKCAVCAKTAYPLESVTVLERTYHKACFKCFICKQSLNLRNFKGHEGKIYCFTHNPQTDKQASATSKNTEQDLDWFTKYKLGLTKSNEAEKSTEKLSTSPVQGGRTVFAQEKPGEVGASKLTNVHFDVEKFMREKEKLQEEINRLTKLNNDYVTQLDHKNATIGQLNHAITVQQRETDRASNEVVQLSIRLDEVRSQTKQQAEDDKSNEISKLQAHVTSLEQQLALTVKACEESKTRAKQLQQELDTATVKYRASEAKGSYEETEKEELRMQIKGLKEHNQRQADALKKQNEDTAILNTKLFEKEQSHATELLVLKNHNNKLEAEVTALRRSLNETCEKLSANLETLGNMERETDALRKENGKLQGSTAAFQKEVAGKDGVLEQLRKILGDAQKETEHWKNTARSLQEKLESSMTNAAQSEMATSEFMAKYTKSMQEVDESKEHLARLQTELIDNRAENEQLNMEVVTLNNLIEELREENTAMHTQLQEAEEMQDKLAEQHEKINRVAQEQSDTIKTLQTTTTRQAQSMHELQQEITALKSKGTHHTKYLWEQERQEALAKVHRLESEIEVLRNENAKIRNTQRDEAAILAYRDERERLGGDISSVVNFLAESHKLAVQLQSSVSAANYTMLKWHEFTSKAINSQEERVQKSTVVTVPVYGIGYDYVDKVLSVLNDRGEQCNPTLVFYHDIHISPKDPTNELAVLVSQDNEKDKELETIVRELGYAHVLKLQQGPTDIDENGTFPLEITGENIVIKQNILHKLFDVIGNSL